jgi:predicted negative regulator of RcsB-dependent stress response
MTYVYRGNVYASRGQRAEAVTQYRRALSINGNNLAAQQGLTMAQTPSR